MREDTNASDAPIYAGLSHLWLEIGNGGSLLMGRLADYAPWFGKRMFMKMSFLEFGEPHYIEFAPTGAINGKGLIRAVATHQKFPPIPHESMILLAFSGPLPVHF